MMENPEPKEYSVGVLVVSDTVFKKEKEDRSGKNLASILKSQKYFRVSALFEACVPDEKQEIEKKVKHWTDDESVDLILTVGGTGFSPRDVTPEATRAIIEKEAPHIASYMVISCCEKTKFAVLSRSVCGIRSSSLILNLPGSSKSSEESLEAIASVLPHAMDQLKQDVPKIVADHIRIQGIMSTPVTPSVISPVPSVVTVSSPSVPEGMQTQQVRNPMEDSQGPQSSPVTDEGCQASELAEASTVPASSSLSEEGEEPPKPNNKRTMSPPPPTPNTLPPPGAASMSLNEFESVSSPKRPRMNESTVINDQTYDPHPIKLPDGTLKSYDVTDDTHRRLFLNKLLVYNEKKGTPLTQCPTISKQPLDFYRIYLAVKERGGFVEVTKGRMWIDIAGLMGFGAYSSTAYALRMQYTKHILPFECKFDRGGIDPGPLISLASSLRKNAKNADNENNA